MIIPLHSIKLTEDQLDVARGIAISEINEVSANMEIFADSLRRTYLFKDFDLMEELYSYMKMKNIPVSGQGLDEHRLQDLFFHYHTVEAED